jgi:hypothetical protein
MTLRSTSRRDELRRIYSAQFRDPRRERRLLSAVAFAAAFGTARAVTHALKGGGGEGGIEIGGRHIHHLTFGILGLLGSGYAMVEGIGVRDARRHRNRSRAIAAFYGASAALTLDEFALWLDLDDDDYWSSEGRKSVDAAVLFGNALALSAASRGIAGEIVKVLAKRSPARAARLSARAAMRQPRRTLSIERSAA